MFKKLKDKLKSFFKESEEYIEQSAEKPTKIKKKTEEQIIKEKIIEKTTERVKEEEEKQGGLFKGMKKKFGLIKINQKKLDEITEKLEILLLENNVALEVSDKIKEKIKEQLQDKQISKREFSEKIKEIIKNALAEILVEPFDLIEKIKQEPDKPFVIVFFGINGSGKTTTIAKISYLLQKNNLSCVLSASDTFRAASIEQLEKHANHLNLKVIKHDYGADPAAVAFDAIKYAKAHKIDAVLIDTAGRMHTKSNLLKEMEKIVKVANPNLKIFVGESITGNDATEQAKNFNNSIGIDAIILSKADVDEKGGTALSVSYITKKPIIYLGIGQNYEDIEPFKKEKLFEKLGL